MADNQALTYTTLSTGFRFTDLPTEIQDLIWEASLPPRRVFQILQVVNSEYRAFVRNQAVDRSSSLASTVDDTSIPSAAQYQDYFIFKNRSSPPVALHVCSSSRALVLRKGFFFHPPPPSPPPARTYSPPPPRNDQNQNQHQDQPQQQHRRQRSASDHSPPKQLPSQPQTQKHLHTTPPHHPPPTWFNPAIDVLYIDRNNRRLLRPGFRSTHAGTPLHSLAIPHLDRVSHLGMEWRAVAEDVPSAIHQSMPPVTGFWRSAIEMALTHMPNLKTFNYVLPQVRHKGGIVLGREPHDASLFTPEVVDLPDHVCIPWKARRNVGQAVGMARVNTILADITGLAFGGGRLGGSNAPDVTTWAQVKRDIEADLDEAGAETRAGRNRPVVCGLWLVRPGAALAFAKDDPLRNRLVYE